MIGLEGTIIELVWQGKLPLYDDANNVLETFAFLWQRPRWFLYNLCIFAGIKRPKIRLLARKATTLVPDVRLCRICFRKGKWMEKELVLLVRKNFFTGWKNTLSEPWYNFFPTSSCHGRTWVGGFFMEDRDVNKGCYLVVCMHLRGHKQISWAVSNKPFDWTQVAWRVHVVPFGVLDVKVESK